MDEAAGGQGAADGATLVVAREGLPNRMGDFRNFRNFRYRFCRGPPGDAAELGNDATRYCAWQPLDDREFLRAVTGPRKSARHGNWAICAIPAIHRRVRRRSMTARRRSIRLLVACVRDAMNGHDAESPCARVGRHTPQHCSGTSSGFALHAVHALARPASASSSPEDRRTVFNSEQSPPVARPNFLEEPHRQR
jgi:hypothetical protein